MLSLRVASPQLLARERPEIFKRRPHFAVVRAVEKDSKQFEVDQDKAREALQQLDQQLQSLSQKRTPPPKVKASDVKLTSDQMTGQVGMEISESFLSNAAGGLLLFTFLYNLLFYGVIKPSIDGPDSPPKGSITTQASEAVDSPQSSPPLLEIP
ncbi:uncharacterized protein LOC115734259 [Rhodamnia argentea]|uniref:Uncharacterized protein LOC115734259 n=1 Tax=Rhodamnia argentea TaxID=178133 RepID=A0A8B8NED7_9MYRT|nr:uncharacterized protein LOC115734259 [Rhodamnia argentea]